MISLRANTLFAALSIGLAAPTAAQQARSLPEVEPNNAAQTATLTRLGDTISGTINPADVDYFAVDLEAGTQLELIGAPVPFCRDFALLDPAGNRLAFGDCMEQVDTLRLTIPATGRYLIRVTEFDDAPGEKPLRPYSLHIGSSTAIIDVTSVVNALLGDRAMLDSSTAQWLDQRGNGNGVLDVGDLRAYLRAAGVLPTGISKGQK
jgi:hypothetical protein